jgi:Fe-S-cluster-containing hydrogenase component 2
MEKGKRIQVMPPARLRARAGDIPLSPERYLQLSFFARLTKKPALERYPAALRLRRFRKGERICRQGEAGWTAFCALTGADVLALGDELLQAAGRGERAALGEELRRLGQRREAPGAAASAAGRVATVHLALGRSREAPAPGLLGRLGRAFFGGPPGPAAARPRYIPIDAPRHAEYDSRQAALYEGELFGAMSCMVGSPRAGTVVADRDWYVLEMLPHILDLVQRDDGFRAEMDRTYKEHVLAHDLRRLPIFSDLPDELVALVRARVELVRCKLGEVICDEHERCDGLYIIRSGLVKTVQNTSYALSPGDVLDWPGLCARLGRGAREQAGPLGRVWQALPAAARAALGAAPARVDGEVVYALNDFIRSPAVPDAKAPKDAQERELPADEALREHFRALDREPGKWADAGRRLFGRLYLEALCPGALRRWAARKDLEYILCYQSSGECIGELDLITGGPCSATCVAYVHPEPGQGHAGPVASARWRASDPLVELVRIPGPLFRELLESSAEVRRRVEEAGRHERRRRELPQAPTWDGARDVPRSERFRELGLIQGQELMLIDLERCTRCDECVRACVATHEDGRSRLFLDGPRFGKYLVPTTCRSCLDPVCLIGCPVGSIHRGDHREIVIEDWCIGCGLCAGNCPYGSIQMHDIGIIPQGVRDWRYYPSARAGAGWVQPDYPDRRWLSGQTPFRNDPDFRDSLRALPRGPGDPGGGAALCFRHELELPAGVLRSASAFALEVTAPVHTPDIPPALWVNGQELSGDVKPRQGKRTYAIARDTGPWRAGRNVLAVQVVPSGQELEVLLDLRLDEVRQPLVLGALTGDIKVVSERAVVCDLCSGRHGPRPACVTACPHDAALRVDARSEFPAP